MKKNIIVSLGILILIAVSFVCIHLEGKQESLKTNKIQATVLAADDSNITVQDKNNIIYTFQTEQTGADIGSNVVIQYTGLLNKNEELQKVNVINYKITPVSQDEDGINKAWNDKGIFSQYYVMAKKKLDSLSLDEKIGQLFLVRYPDNKAIEDIKKYGLSGFVFFEKDFKNKTKKDVQQMIKSLQKTSNIPLLTAVDEEGGRVIRISSNSNLRSEKFKSPKELYQSGGLDRIKQDTIEKSNLLKNLGLNVNLAPVVDVSTNPSDYIYDRTIGENTNITSQYAKTVIDASKGTGVSYTLKHFPGYGNNSDTHNGGSTDNRTIEDLNKNDLPPFKSGIEAGAEAVLVSHNTITNIDPNNPASLSPSVHNLLRNDMDFTGIIITDDLSMGAVSSDTKAVEKAILAGNDLIITTNYEDDIDTIKKAVDDGTISTDQIDKLAFRVLAWKYYKGLMIDYMK